MKPNARQGKDCFGKGIVESNICVKRTRAAAAAAVVMVGYHAYCLLRPESIAGQNETNSQITTFALEPLLPRKSVEGCCYITKQNKTVFEIESITPTRFVCGESNLLPRRTRIRWLLYVPNNFYRVAHR